MFAFFFLEDHGYFVTEAVVFSPNEKKSLLRRFFNRERDIFTHSPDWGFIHFEGYENSGETKEV